MKGLTPRQKAVLDIIAESMSERGYPPTIREIGKLLGIKSTNGVNDHLKALERKGFLYRDKSKSRAIRLVGEEGEPVLPSVRPEESESWADNLLAVPFIGRIAAGSPILAEENREATYHVDAALLGSRSGRNEVFVLKVRGESMIEEGIYDGDLIFVERASEARRGEMVAAMVDGDATVKRFYRDGDVVRLEPANREMVPILVTGDEGRDVSIIGRVIGVFRRV